MPTYKTNEEKSENRLRLEPIRLNTVHRRIMRLEIAGRRPGEKAYGVLPVLAVGTAMVPPAAGAASVVVFAGVAKSMDFLRF